MAISPVSATIESIVNKGGNCMYLYRLEAETSAGALAVVIVAEGEEQAFAAAEEHLQRHFLPAPAVAELTIVEKKRIAPGAGYVVQRGPAAV